MKKFKFASVLALSGVLIVSACTKEKVVPIDNSNQTIATENTADVGNKAADDVEEIFFRLDNGDELVEMNSIEWTDETHFFYDYEGRNIVFTSDDRMLDWAHEDASREIYVEKYHFYKEQQEFAIANGYWDDEEATERYVQELLREAGADGGDRITLSILFNNTFYGGTFLPVLITYPSLGGFNNRAESMWMPINAGALCDRTWYRGAKFWYFAIPAGGFPTLGGFNNRAESVF